LATAYTQKAAADKPFGLCFFGVASMQTADFVIARSESDEAIQSFYNAGLLR
jgi:hypothetical protein